MVRLHTCIVLLAAFSFVSGGRAYPALGEDFRVDNMVYAANEKEPSSQSTTIFHGGVVYDCMKSPEETVVFDKAASRFVLLNLTQRARTEISTGKIMAFVDGLQSRAAKGKEPLLQFLAEPKFEERADDSSGELTFSSTLVNYTVTLAPEANPSIVQQYREFCDWYARLHPLLVPGASPPFARLQVNAALAQRQATASQVVLTMSSGRGLKPQHTTIRSVHHIVRPLAPADLERVAQTRTFMDSLKLVTFDQYRKLEPR
jgi:hypothetical protein